MFFLFFFLLFFFPFCFFLGPLQVPANSNLEESNLFWKKWWNEITLSYRAHCWSQDSCKDLGANSKKRKTNFSKETIKYWFSQKLKCIMAHCWSLRRGLNSNVVYFKKRFEDFPISMTVWIWRVLFFPKQLLRSQDHGCPMQTFAEAYRQ